MKNTSRKTYNFKLFVSNPDFLSEEKLQSYISSMSEQLSRFLSTVQNEAGFKILPKVLLNPYIITKKKISFISLTEEEFSSINNLSDSISKEAIKCRNKCSINVPIVDVFHSIDHIVEKLKSLMLNSTFTTYLPIICEQTEEKMSDSIKSIFLTENSAQYFIESEVSLNVLSLTGFDGAIFINSSEEELKKLAKNYVSPIIAAVTDVIEKKKPFSKKKKVKTDLTITTAASSESTPKITLSNEKNALPPEIKEHLEAIKNE